MTQDRRQAGTAGPARRGCKGGPWRRRNRPVYGAVDLGSNNCRLLIAIPCRDRPKIIDAFSRIVRLGEGVGETSALSPAAMDRAITALQICRSKMARRGVQRMRCIATAACREADNAAAFVARVRGETGLDLEIIDPEEEARLAVASCRELLDLEAGEAVVFDIGGGSTEIIRVRADVCGEPEVVWWSSLPFGVITLSERFAHDRMSPDDFEAMIGEARRLMAPVRENDGFGSNGAELRFLGTSGTITTIAGVHLGLARYNRSRVDGLTLSAPEIDAVTDRLAAMTCAERAAEPCIGPERADMVLAGCAILEAMKRLWDFSQLRVADRGLREGILLDLMQADGRLRRAS